MNRFGDSMQNLRCSGASPERNDAADFYEERDRQESFRAQDEAREKAKPANYEDHLHEKRVTLLNRRDTWSLIANKAHLYSTAFDIVTCEYIKILGVRTVGVFTCVLRDGTTKDIGCEMLHDYGI